MIHAVLFDFNGVILDDETVHRDLFREILAPLSIPLTDSDYETRYLGLDDRGCIGAAWEAARGTPVPEQTLKSLVSQKSALYEQRMNQGLPLYPGAAELIRGLWEKVPLAIVSGALRPEILHALERHRLISFFSFIVSAEDTPRGKPDPAGYRMAWTRFLSSALPAAGPEEIAVIEDSVQGIDAAREAGMKTIAVGHTYPLSALEKADRKVSHIGLLTPDLVLSL